MSEFMTTLIAVKINIYFTRFALKYCGADTKFVVNSKGSNDFGREDEFALAAVELKNLWLPTDK
jgi:hypothetical protein